MSLSVRSFKNTFKKQAASGWMNRFIYIYPFTVSGSILFIAAVILLAKSYSSGNPYGFMLSIGAFFTLTLVTILGRLQAARSRNIRVLWGYSQSLYAEVEENHQRIWIDGTKIFNFYRLHFKISGTVMVGRNAGLYISSEKIINGGKEFLFPLHFPFSGEFRAKGSLSVRDIFGLTRARVGKDYLRNLIIQPAPFSGSKSYHIEAVGGFEEKNRQKSSDEERYYMREYIPGDRFRDINWKSSSRLSQLITKISPYTQEKMKLVNIEFRHFRKNQRETVESLVHLNILKSWLLSFIRSLKAEHPEYHFSIKTGNGIFRLETDDDIDSFNVEISTLFFQSEPQGFQIDPGVGEIFIFTTPYDEELPSVLAFYQKTRTYIFMTTSNSRDRSSEKTRTVHLFKSFATMPFPGIWVVCRDRNLTKPNIAIRAGGKLEEYSIEVKIF